MDTKLKGREKDGLDRNREMRELKETKINSVITIQTAWHKILCLFLLPCTQQTDIRQTFSLTFCQSSPIHQFIKCFLNANRYQALSLGKGTRYNYCLQRGQTLVEEPDMRTDWYNGVELEAPKWNWVILDGFDTIREKEIKIRDSSLEERIFQDTSWKR